jgi:23S rRNA (cytidine2498-2'-O)-methyltransferase
VDAGGDVDGKDPLEALRPAHRTALLLGAARRVAARMSDWFVQGWCRRAIFNLKLPMKKRRAEVQANLADFHARCEAAGVAVQTRARQLYHDREEITVLAWTGR